MAQIVGHEIAHDGRSFSPSIPAGATVSWKLIQTPVFVSEQNRVATHILAVWDHFEEMGADWDDLRDTPRGPCVAYYADAESIEDLVESAVPAPPWVDPDVPSERDVGLGGGLQAVSILKVYLRSLSWIGSAAEHCAPHRSYREGRLTDRSGGLGEVCHGRRYC